MSYDVIPTIWPTSCMIIIPTFWQTCGMTSFRPFEWHLVWHSDHLTDRWHDIIQTIWRTCDMTVIPAVWLTSGMTSFRLFDWPAIDGHSDHLTDLWHDVIPTIWLICSMMVIPPIWLTCGMTVIPTVRPARMSAVAASNRYPGIQPRMGSLQANIRIKNGTTDPFLVSNESMIFFSGRRWSPFPGVFSRFWWAEGATALARVDRLQQLLYKIARSDDH